MDLLTLYSLINTITRRFWLSFSAGFSWDSGTVGGYNFCMSVPGSRIEEMELELATAPELAGILDELASREPIFHRVEFGTSRVDFEKMTDEQFWEVGASGRRYSRKFVLDELARRFSAPHPDVWETRGFHCQRLGKDTYLLTYTLIQDPGSEKARVTRRSTIWRQAQDGWKIVFHQGTVVEDCK
jgi:hypothetical protein